MKKTVLKAVLASAFIFAIVINLSVNQKSQKQDVSLVMKNIEALAYGEGSCEPPYNQENYHVFIYYQSGKCYINCTSGGDKTCCIGDHC